MNFIVALISFEIMGICALFLLSPKDEEDKYSVAEFISLSFLLGCGIASIMLFGMHLAGLAFNSMNIGICVLFFIFCVFLICLLGGRTDPRLIRLEGGNKLKTAEILLLSAIAIQLIWIVMLVIPVPVNSHDAVANFALKAKMFHFADGIPAGFFQFPEEVVAHPDYPMLLPLTMTWVYEFTGFNDLAVNMLMPCFFGAFLLLFYSLMRKVFKRTYAILLTFVLATIPQVGNYATILYADLIFAAYLSAAFIYLFLYFSGRGKRHFMLSAVMLALAVLTKNEAIVFVGGYFLVLLLKALRDKGLNLKPVLAAIVVFALLCGPWCYVKATSGAANSDIDIRALTAERVLQNVKDLPEFFDLFQQQIFGPKKWNIFWIMLVAAMVWRRKKLLEGDTFYLTVFFAFTVLGYFAAYMVMTGENLYFYANTTLSRFMIHFAPLALFLMALICKDDVYELETYK